MGTPEPRRIDLSAAAQDADVGRPLPADTRLRSAKSLVLRAARVFTHRQTAFNQSILASLDDLATHVDHLARRDLTDSGDDISSVRSDLAEVSLQLAELRQMNPGAERSTVPGPAGFDPLRGHEAGSRSSEAKSSPGVNVFGDWAATTGIAQAARRLTVALADAGFDLSLGTVRSGAPVDETRVPEALRKIPDDRRQGIDLWMLNVNEFPAIQQDLLRPADRSTYAIGVWYWELTTFPESLIAQMSRVDEIWVATSFVQSSFRKATDRPVHIVPAVVPDLRGSGRTRKEFGLGEDEVVFLFSFDVHSMVARKNPGAVIEAFRRAFRSPGSDSREFGSLESGGVRLLVKVLNLDRHPAVAKWLRDEVASVGGLLIEDDLGTDEMVDLFACADSYVSLHRSEGFGFGIAESMALGKPVIATAYSGNTDFATAANSCQVGYRLSEITDADHIYDEGASEVYRSGSLWAEPDVSQAARWMQVIARDPELRKHLGDAARETISEHYSAARAVQVVRTRLADAAARARLLS